MSIEDENNFDNIKSITLPKKTMPTWYYSLLEWWPISKLIDLKYWIIGLWYKTCRMFAYAKFGATNPDFDHNFLIEILEFKLIRMKKEFESSPYHDNEDIVKEISHVLSLIASYKEDDFTKKDKEEHEKMFGKSFDEWKPLPSGDYEWLMHYEKDGVVYKQGTEHVNKASNAFSEIYKLNDKKRKECLHKIMYYMAENMEKWWD